MALPPTKALADDPTMRAMREQIQAAYAAATDLDKRIWGESGTPGATDSTVQTHGRERREAWARHAELSKAYEDAREVFLEAEAARASK